MRKTTAKTEKLSKGIRKILKTKRTPGTADADVRRGFYDELDPYIFAGIGQNAEEARFHPSHEELMEYLWFPPYFPGTVELDKYANVIPFPGRWIDSTLSTSERVPLQNRGILLSQYGVESRDR